ncbi:MAG TPA: CPBP family glutamic-type intramembrane protease [Lacipirellulaceae bacterium]|nr:CPBP family glutamic-type intramembrane protease [Lacipirellulaceae bacterium]
MHDAATPPNGSSPPAGLPPEAPEKAPPPPCPYLDPENAPLPPSGWLRRWPGVTFLLPFVVFMVFNSLPLESAPTPEELAAEKAAAEREARGEPSAISLDELKEQREARQHAKIPYEHYPIVYSLKIGFTLLAMLVVLPGYRAFPFRVHAIAWLVGAVGAVVWIGLCKLHLEPKLLEPLGLGKFLDFVRRPGFDPLTQIKDNPQWAYGFLAIRFFGLVLVISVVEEFFLRGFLMRYVMDIDWHLIPFAVVNRLALIVGTAFPMLMHPGELFAAAAWFSLITWLMLRTKNIWDCVIAHAVTNLLMALWDVWSGDWWLM